MTPEKMGNEEILECCMAVLAFVDLSNGENMDRMDRALEKNGFPANHIYSTNSWKHLPISRMINFFGWLCARQGREFPMKIDDFFSAEKKGTSQARAMLVQAIRDIKIEISLVSSSNSLMSSRS